MGVVYRARDTRLDRTVAIKVLPADVAADPERRERFEREARAIAALNHPHICVLHDVGREASSDFLVMELVDGESLDERLKRGALPRDEAVRLALQLVDALEAAHARGIVHRDLKPANIRITADGTLKVLDFGLAKALDSAESGAAVDAANSPTFSPGATRMGIILGTAAYMSPEQARGQRVDRRTDIWAFGCVLYDMLTARQAFGGPTVSDTIAAVLNATPDWSALPPDITPGIRRALARCLERDLRRRLHDIADVRLDLEEPAPASAPLAATTTATPRPRTRAIALGVVLVTAIASVFAGRLWERRNTPPPNEWTGDLLGGATAAAAPRISPDGRTLAFEAMVDGQTQVAVMNPQSGNWTILTHERTKGAVQDMSWSRDGSRIYFDRFSELPRGIYSIPSLGGDERLLLEDAETPAALADGSLLVVRINKDRQGQVFHFWPENGRLEALDAYSPSANDVVPVRVFPDGREALFVGTTREAPDARRLYALDLASGRTRPLMPVPSELWGLAIAAAPDGRSVFIVLRQGSASIVVTIPREGGTPRSVMTLTGAVSLIDVGPDGSLYVDQTSRTPEALWYSPADARIERLTLPESTRGSGSGVGSNMLLPLPGGRVLVTAMTGAHQYVALAAPGKDPVPFVGTDEPTTFPYCLLGSDRIAFVIGANGAKRIGIASTVDGRLLRRLDRPDAAHVDALAGSVDGRTLFYVEAGIVWAVPAEGGEPRKVHEGNTVAADPDGRSLIIQIAARDAVRLVRLPVGGGDATPIEWQGDPIFIDLSPSAVAPDGRIAVRVVPKDSWFWPTAILDPRRGVLSPIPGVREIDMLSAAWTSDGRVVAFAVPFRSSLWRFQPAR